MDQHDSFFIPERVDEQIDQALDAKQAMSDDQFLAAMQQVAHQIRAEHGRSLQRVEDRLMQRALARPERRALVPREGSSRSSEQRIVQQESIYSMEKLKEQKKFRMSSMGPRISVLVAILVMAVLVGSLVFVIRVTRQNTAQHPNNNTHVGAAQTPTSTSEATQPPPNTFGTTVYTTPGNTFGFGEVAWSPDSTRVASLIETEGVQIWDATTGNHLVNVQLPGGAYVAYSLSWSPNSQLIALGTNVGILIVNSQTGVIVHSYSVGAVANTPLPAGSVLLAAHMPTGGGLGVRGLAWSHDGKSLAVAISEGPTGTIEVLNPQTGSVDYTLPITGNYVPSALSWSADGKYLAAGVFNTEPGDTTVPTDQQMMVWAWNTATKQVVFRHAGGNNTDSVAWSPTSDTLAFGALQTQGGVTRYMLSLWNTTTNHLTTLQAGTDGPLTWSPDGQYIAFSGTTHLDASPNLAGPPLVSVVYASTGKLVYEYRQMTVLVATLAWSPNGKYIVSGEGGTVGTCVASVWTAE